MLLCIPTTVWCATAQCIPTSSCPLLQSPAYWTIERATCVCDAPALVSWPGHAEARCAAAARRAAVSGLLGAPPAPDVRPLRRETSAEACRPIGAPRQHAKKKLARNSQKCASTSGIFLCCCCFFYHYYYHFRSFSFGQLHFDCCCS